MSRDFKALLDARWDRGLFLCVGLDPDDERIPAAARRDGIKETFLAFTQAAVDATRAYAAAFKPNSAFFEAHGEAGVAALRELIAYIQRTAPDVPVILDAKRGDIGNTNAAYARAAFDHLRADAITVHPYLGGESLREFFSRKDKGVFVMCRNSNAGSGEFQDISVEGRPLFVHVARTFREKWNENGNCGLVVGATYPEDIRQVREAAPGLTLLIPGIGAQGGGLARSVAGGKDPAGRGILIGASRAILYASDGDGYADAMRAEAEKIHGAISQALVQ